MIMQLYRAYLTFLNPNTILFDIINNKKNHVHMHGNFNYFKLISKLLSSFPIFLCKLGVFSEREHENHKE